MRGVRTCLYLLSRRGHINHVESEHDRRGFSPWEATRASGVIARRADYRTGACPLNSKSVLPMCGESPLTAQETFR